MMSADVHEKTGILITEQPTENKVLALLGIRERGVRIVVVAVQQPAAASPREQREIAPEFLQYAAP